jgi:uncharacterized protein YcfL
MKTKMLLGSALVAVVAAGCAKSVNTVEIGETGHSWVQTDPWLNNKAAVTRVNKAFQGDILQAQVWVTNREWGAVNFMYRFVYLDNNGMTLDTPLTNWQRATVQPQQSVTLQAVAPDARVRDIRLEMKRPDKDLVNK